MIQDVELEVLLFSSRHTLDAYQLVSAKANQIIQRNNDKFPRRRINLLRVNESYVIQKGNGVSCEMYFDPCMRDTFFIRHAEPTVLYERAAIRIRNAFITNVQFVCLPCAGFLPWLHDHPDVWSNCRVETMLLNGFFCARDHQRTIPDDLLPTVVDDLAVSKLRLGVTRPEHLVRVHQLMHRPLIHLKSLTLELSQEVLISTTDFVDYLFDCNHLDRVDLEYSARDASQWVTAYIERFIDADVVGRIVPTVAIRMDGDVQPDRPVICEKAIGTTDDASPFFSDLDGDEPTASCTFYEFENPARRELLRIYCGSATRRLVLDGLRSTHFFFLQIVDIA